ncbi:zinc-dependent metalloprotease [Solitalea longa]|uniref:Zinc-dependent metalloprotease n=1 Tax=Solitalea longa TaxID=2079460 RepID=A0A2S5A8K0_9SPHI|nr:zinc-dependent metalloprotease [Solitalea longa]POY38619.1 zinc-dependent metalloprotease [Solitalea longa]
MKLKFIPVLAIALFAAKTGFAQDSAGVKKPSIAVAKLKPYKEVISAKAKTQTGLFKVHKVDEKYYFEIPDSLLKREFLFTTRFSKVANGSPRYAGELGNGIIVSFEKAPNDKLFVRAVTSVAYSDSSNAISRAVRNATIDPIIMTLELKSRGDNNKSSVIDVTDFFTKENQLSGLHPQVKKELMLSSPAADRSFVLSMDAYPTNIEVKSVKTFGMASDGPSAGATFEISNSVMVLPKTPMEARAYDPRVGFLGDGYKVFSDAQQKVEEKQFTVRLRLEPKDLNRYKAGELVEPKEPIVFYVDPATPKQWRPYIIQGINDWNQAFEAAGFKNAIIGKEWPENDTTMNIDDARYKVVRYFPSTSPIATGNRINDPRTGEILETYVGWSHSQITFLHHMYMVQAGATDPGARNMKFSDELMGALIRADISREIGHSLGLRDNIGSSSTIVFDKLRDKKWLENHPYNNSIMDYSHYNYVAQPQDQVGRKGLIPQIGDYDKWAIKWGYSYTGKDDFTADKNVRLKWIEENVKPNSSLWYAAFNSASASDPTDPSVVHEDLSNDAMKAGEYGIKNLKVVMSNLLKWTKTPNEPYYNASEIYNIMGIQYAFLVRNVYANIGGVHENVKTSGQSGDVYTPVAKSVQKAAVAFLGREVFTTPQWLIDPNVLNKFSKPALKDKILDWQENTIIYAISDARFYRLNSQTMRYGAEKAYSVDEYLTDLNKALWGELTSHQPIDMHKRVLQKSALAKMIKIAKTASEVPDPSKPAPTNDLSGTDVPAVLEAHLRKIANQSKAAIPAYTDAATVGHLKYVVAKINTYFESKN